MKYNNINDTLMVQIVIYLFIYECNITIISNNIKYQRNII